MKKAIILLLAGIMLAGCSDADKSEKSSDSDKKPEATESTNSESSNDQVTLEEGLKGDSTEVAFEEVAQGEVPSNKKVSFTGTIFAIEEGRYGLKSDVADSSEEVLWVDDIRLGERSEIPEGTTVQVYGSYTETDENDVPKIRAVFMDPK
ncbi:hypothetical protein [Sporosarcina sp. A2]|uniref:hypothetical protein n=1 Tax=Sporosarcina sp. A2 TaxID=3393449 RepID=UPI003D7B71CE